MEAAGDLHSKPTKKVRAGEQPRPALFSEDDIRWVTERSHHRFLVKKQASDFDLKHVGFKAAGAAVYELCSRLALPPVFLILVKPWSGVALAAQQEVGVSGQFKELFGDFHCLYVTVDDGQAELNHLIISPDVFVNVTAVTAGLHCARKTFLEPRFARNGRCWERDGLLGTLKHRLFELVVTEDSPFERLSAEQVIEREIIAESEFFLGQAPELFAEFAAELRQTIADSAEFKRKFIAGKSPIPAGENSRLVISRIVKAEFGVSSGRFSLKGKIDLLLVCSLHTGELLEEVVVPFELKTGKPKEEHKDQLMLYSACVNDCFRPGALSLLHYAGREAAPRVVRSDARVFAAMLRRRNEVALELASPALPPPISCEFKCSNFCNQNLNCAFLTVKEAADSRPGDAAAGGLKDIEELVRRRAPLFKQLRELLASNFLDRKALEHAERLLGAIDREDAADGGDFYAGFPFFLANLFALVYNYKRGRDAPALAAFDLFLAKGRAAPGDFFFDYFSLDKFVVFRHRRSPDFLLDGRVVHRQLVEHQGHCIFKVYLAASASAMSLLLGLQRSDRQFVQTFSADWSVSVKNSAAYQHWRVAVVSLLTEPKARPLALIVLNENRLLEAEHFLDSLGEQLADAPTKPRPFGGPSRERLAEVSALFSLNAGQAAALEAAVSCAHYQLVLGYCATGKALLAASILLYLLRTASRTLFVAKSPARLQRVMELLAGKCSEAERRSCLSLSGARAEGVEQFSRGAASGRAEHRRQVDRLVFFCAADAVGAFRFRPDDFAFAVVDQAARLNEPETLPCLFPARKFVLIGDCLLERPEARAEASPLAVSLFERLHGQRPEAAALLSKQYRLSGDIAQLANRLFYRGGLQPARQEVVSQLLRFDYDESRKVPTWIKELLFRRREVVWLDSGPVRFQLNGAEVECECKDEQLAAQVLGLLLGCGVAAAGLAVVCHPNTQRDALRAKLPGFDNVLELEQFLHREFAAAVLLVGRGGRRALAAATRARSKLVLVGDAAAARRDRELGPVLAFFAERDWILSP